MTDVDRLLEAVLEDPRNCDRRMVYADALQDADRVLEAIMQRVIARPGDDQFRFDYADELARMAGKVPCRLCRGEYDEIRGVNGCRVCSGTGRVSDGRKEWAEFIRVQVELFRLPSKGHGKGPYYRESLRTRERELWPSVRGAFAGEGAVPVLSLSETPVMLDSDYPGELIFSAQSPIVLIRGGLSSVVRSTLAEWMGGECENCQGDGTVEDGRHENVLHGCPDCGGEDEIDSESGRLICCPGTGRTPGIGPILVQRWPIVEVMVTDRRPHFAGDLWWFHNRSDAYQHWPDDCRLPRELLAATGGHFTEAAAFSALSDELLLWARTQRIGHVGTFNWPT